MSAETPDPREDRLPQWIQRDLAVLRRNLADAKAELARQRPTVGNHLDLTGLEPFTLHGKSTGYLYVPFDEDVTASWLIEDDGVNRPSRIDISVRSDAHGRYLNVRSDGGRLDIQPHVTNVIELRIVDR